MLVDAYSPAALYHFALHYYRSRYGLPPVKSAHDIPKMLGPPYQDIQEDKFITKTYKLSSTSSLDKYVPPKLPAGTDKRDCPSPYQEEAVFNVLEYPNPINPVPACTVAPEDPTPASRHPLLLLLLLQKKKLPLLFLSALHSSCRHRHVLRLSLVSNLLRDAPSTCWCLIHTVHTRLIQKKIHSRFSTPSVILPLV